MEFGNIDSDKKYFEVFDKKNKIRHGFTSDSEKEKIEEKYPDRYSFKILKYVTVEDLEHFSKYHLRLTVKEKIMMVIVMLIVTVSILVIF